MNLAERFLNYALMIQLSNSHGKSANYISVSIDGDALTTFVFIRRPIHTVTFSFPPPTLTTSNNLSLTLLE